MLANILNELKAGIKDSESLILFVFICENKIENYFHFIFSWFTAFLKQNTEIIIRAPVVVKSNLIEIR